MKNLLFFSDLHINSESLLECSLILEEIGSIAKQYDCDTIFNLGDIFDTRKPNSQELDLFASWIKDLRPKYDVLFLYNIIANSHESDDRENSIVNHYEILNECVKNYKQYEDGNNLFCGHFIVKGAKFGFNPTIEPSSLKHKVVFLGHQHTHEKIGNVYQLGSSRFITFSEWQDKKVVAVIIDYKGANEKLEFIELKYPIKMAQIELKYNNSNKLEQKIGQKDQNLPSKSPVEPLLKRKRGRPRKCPQNSNLCKVSSQETQMAYDFSGICHFLDNLDPNTKVKVIIKDFSSYKQFVNVEEKYKQKFVRFIRVNDFSLVSEIGADSAKNKTTLKESFDRFTKKKNIDNEIINIIKKEIK